MNNPKPFIPPKWSGEWSEELMKQFVNTIENVNFIQTDELTYAYYTVMTRPPPTPAYEVQKRLGGKIMEVWKFTDRQAAATHIEALNALEWEA